MNRRALIAAGIVLAWLGGVGMLVRREFFRPHIDRLAEAALRVTPDVMFYAVLQGERQVGFASSTIDTTTTEIEQRDYMVADQASGDSVLRTETRTNVILSRTLRMKSFDLEYEADGVPVKVTGVVDGDSALMLSVLKGAGPAETRRVPLDGPVLVPALVPLAVALDERPGVGRSVTLPLFDQATLQPRLVRVQVRAESLFVVNDSSVFDSASGRWQGVLPDTLRGWQLSVPGGSGVSGWVDEQGRLIASSQQGFQLVRRPYEVAFENWRLADTGRRIVTRTVARPEVPAASASAGPLLAAQARPDRLNQLRLTVLGPIAGLDMEGGRQRRDGDTLTVERESAFDMVAEYSTSRRAADRARTPELQAEPLIEASHPEIVALAARLSGRAGEPRIVAREIHRWVQDSVTTVLGTGTVGALPVLQSREGDATGRTLLFVALARAAGVPARVANGVVYVRGRFHTHTWPEILLRDWVAVDPALGLYPAGASHIRLRIGPLSREGDLTRLLGNLHLNVLSPR